MKNIRTNPDEVYVQFGFRRFLAKFEIVDDLSEREIFWRWFLRENQRLAKAMIGWDSRRDNPETADLSFLVNNITIVRLHRPS